MKPIGTHYFYVHTTICSAGSETQRSWSECVRLDFRSCIFLRIRPSDNSPARVFLRSTNFPRNNVANRISQPLQSRRRAARDISVSFSSTDPRVAPSIYNRDQGSSANRTHGTRHRFALKDRSYSAMNPAAATPDDPNYETTHFLHLRSPGVRDTKWRGRSGDVVIR